MKSLHFLLSLFVVGVNGNKLPICGLSKNITERRLCKLSSKYPNYPFEIQPKITINEVLDIDDIEKSITVSIETFLYWNDTAINIEGPRDK